MLSRVAMKSIFVPILLIMATSETISRIVFMRNKNRRTHGNAPGDCRVIYRTVTAN